MASIPPGGPQGLTATETVVEALRRRRAMGGRTPFNDGMRIALVAEGGAMRGVLAGGMVSAIEAEGFAECFDLMVGTSAGACALAYLRAGQARFGTRMFYEDLNTGVFIDLRRAVRGGPAVSIDYLVDEVFARIKPLDLEALRRPGAVLHATATDIDRAELAALTGFEIPGRALEILRATSRMPLLSGGPVELDGMRLLDGGLLARAPVSLAAALGATHVLALLTKSPGAKGIRKPSFTDRWIGNATMGARHGAALKRRIEAEHFTYRDLYAALAPGREVMIEGVAVQPVFPAPDGPQVGRTTQDGEVLRAAAAHGEAQARAVLLGA